MTESEASGKKARLNDNNKGETRGLIGLGTMTHNLHGPTRTRKRAVLAMVRAIVFVMVVAPRRGIGTATSCL